MHSQSRIHHHAFTVMHSQSCIKSAGAGPGLAGDALTVCDSGMQPGQLVQLAHFLPQQRVPQDVHCET